MQTAKWRLLVGALAATLLAPGCRRGGTPATPGAPVSAARSTAIDRTSAGVERLLESDWAEADNAFREAILADPKYAPARVLRAAGHLLAGDDGAAVGELRIVLGMPDPPGMVTPLLARASYRRGSIENARELFDACVANHPASAEARLYTALASRTPEAMRGGLNALLEAQPEYWDARVVRGRVNAVLEDTAGAIADVLMCLRQRPDDATLWWQLADHLGQAGRPNAEAFALERVIESDAGWSTAYERLAQLAAARGDSEKAAEWIDLAIESDSSRRDELSAMRSGLSGGSAASAAPKGEHAAPGDVAQTATWIEYLRALSSENGTRERLIKLQVMAILSELHAASLGRGLPAAWDADRIAAERARLAAESAKTRREVQELLNPIVAAGAP